MKNYRKMMLLSLTVLCLAGCGNSKKPTEEFDMQKNPNVEEDTDENADEIEWIAM